MNTIYENLTKACPTLFIDRKFHCVVQAYEPAVFGNSFAVIENVELRFRIIRDRGQTFGEIASPFDPDIWFDLDLGFGSMGFEPNRTATKLDTAEELEALDGLCRKIALNYDRLVSMFSESNIQTTKNILQELAHLRARRLFGASIQPDNNF